jgi:hypothetical protein
LYLEFSRIIKPGEAMKKTVGVWAVIGLLAGLAYGGDNFNDGVRNKALWKVPAGNTGRLVETNTRLYFNSLGSSGYRSAAWLWKTPYTLYSGDLLETSVLICFPKRNIGPTAQILLGMGLANGYQPSAKYITVSMSNYNFEREVVVTSDGVYRPFALPQNFDVFYLVLRYNATTGKLTFWQRATDYSWTSKVGAVKLNNLWSIPLGTPFVLVPYLKGSSDSFELTTADDFCLDDFNVIQTIP